jgi:hypothetical protein
MQFKQITSPLFNWNHYFLIACVFFISNNAGAQSTYLMQGDKAITLLDRLEIKARTDSFFNFSKIRPFGRKHVIAAVNNFSNKNTKVNLSATEVKQS